MDFSQRAGRYVQQPSGYKAFVPAPLPPDPAIAYSGELHTLLSVADRDIGRLDALAALLPNPDLFVAMYVRHEAVLSSQIEGTQSTLEDVLAFEAEAVRDDTPKDVDRRQRRHAAHRQLHPAAAARTDGRAGAARGVPARGP